MGAFLLVEALQIGDVLEVVGVFLALFHSGVGNDVIAVLMDLQVNALLSQNIHHLLQDLGVGGGGGGHVQHHRLGGLSGRFGGSRSRGFFLFGAAGGQGQAQHQGQSQGQKLLVHHCFLQFL